MQSRPLVPSMGHHDPLDGFVTSLELEATARTRGAAAEPRLEAQAADFAQMLDRQTLATSDPLGLGGLLVDACRLVQFERADQDLIASLLAASLTGLRSHVAQPDLRAPAHRRLGFRELGLAIGLAGIPLIEQLSRKRLDVVGRALLAELTPYVALGTAIEGFWLHPEHRRTPSWLEHEDINDVMLATSLAPDGFLTLSGAESARSRAASASPSSAAGLEPSRMPGDAVQTAHGTSLDGLGITMNYDIHVKQVPPQVVVTQRRHTSLAELGNVMHSTLAKVATCVEPTTAARGAPFAVYYNEPFRPEDIDVEMGLPVAGDAKISESADVHRRELSGGPAAYATHVGPYSSIGAAYEALYEWIERHGHERIGPPRELYIVGPGEGTKPEEYRTEIEVPID